MHESQELIKAANHEVFWAILNTFKNHKHVDQRVLNRTIISRLQKLLYDRTGRRPVIIPMVTILNGNNRSENQHYRRPNNKNNQTHKNERQNNHSHRNSQQHSKKKNSKEKQPVATGNTK